jgi:hypothetical protein
MAVAYYMAVSLYSFGEAEECRKRNTNRLFGVWVEIQTGKLPTTNQKFCFLNVLFNDASNCYICIASQIEGWVWSIKGTVLTGENRSIRRKLRHFATWCNKNPTSGSNPDLLSCGRAQNIWNLSRLPQRYIGPQFFFCYFLQIWCLLQYCL